LMRRPPDGANRESRDLRRSVAERKGPGKPGSATSSLDELVEEVNRQILSDMRRFYSPQVVERLHDPRNPGPMREANGHARITGPCGDTMEIWLRIDERRVARATFMTNGCGPTIACGSMATELATGRSTDEAATVEQQDILDALGGLPEASRHCALLAASALKGAVLDYLQRGRATGENEG